MSPTTMESNNRMAMIFDENQRKYKCCCGNMKVRTGAAIIAGLKMFGVLTAVMELFTGPHYVSIFPFDNTDDEVKNIHMGNSGDDSNNSFRALRITSSIVYLLVEAVAVSCLIYAIRTERPKFVIPEMAFISVCMTLEFIVAFMVVVTAAFWSEGIAQMIIKQAESQGIDMTPELIDRLRALLPYILTLFALVLVIAAAFELWFLMVVKSFFRYLRDKQAFRNYGNMVIVQQCYVNGYQPMMEENETGQTKDTPPKYQDVVKAQEGAAAESAIAAPPPSYTEASAEPAVGQK